MTTIPFTEHLSETWLLERTYHAQLSNGRELSVPSLTEAMRQLTDFDAPYSRQSAMSKVAESLPLQKTNIFSVPISTWREITREEARESYQQGNPVLLYSEHAWEHSRETAGTWRPNHNMRGIMPENIASRPEITSGTEYAVCYLDRGQGIFSNVTWKAWFSSDPDILFNYHDLPITFLGTGIQFPFTTHYTVIAWDGKVSEYRDRAAAIQGFTAAPLQEAGQGKVAQMGAPYFSYYNEVTCPSGTYRLEFFGPHMNEQGYIFNRQPSVHQESHT